ncbi:amidophosphoribosyltransferase [Candidatus Pacebacteria bacterium]|nr:amidophosphoribosyltransferase [Candidatus Paceibacterota bacterium]
MCGIIGVYGHDYVAQDVYDGLVTLQHRGQDAAGIISYDGSFHLRKNFGQVQEVFHTRHMKRLQGYAALGHTRYATIGTGDVEEIQPFLGTAPFGVAFVHNGNLFNAPELKKEIFEKDHRLVNSNSDGEVMLNVFTKALTKQNADHIAAKQVFQAVASVHERTKGAYAVICYIASQGMVAFKDPHGIRPLIMGKRGVNGKTEYIFASESATLEIMGYEVVGDLAAGEAVFIDEATRTVKRERVTTLTPTPCVFEYVYFARPDSIINGISVYEARLRMGEKLAQRINQLNLKIDAVMPVPDSGRSATFSIADTLSVPYREGLIKNRYIGRTFIMPGQKIRKKSIRYKLNPIEREIKGKNVLLIDDSIVRGNTSRRIIEMMREAGANKVYFASYAPPIMYPNIYGIDIPTKAELIAARLSVAEIKESLGADELIYGTVDDMAAACLECNQSVTDLDMSCFDGVYKTNDVDELVLNRIEAERTNERVDTEDIITNADSATK